MWKDTEKKPIGIYLLLTFAIAWISEAILIVGERTSLITGTAGFILSYVVIGFGAGFAPAYATYIILRRYKKIDGFKSFATLIFKGNSVRNTIIVTVLFFASQLLVNLITNTYTGEALYMFILYIPLMVIGGGIEEVGWRGFLQPALEEKYHFTISGIIVGVIWAVWHLPLWLVQNSSQSSTNFISFLCYCIVFSFVLGTLYKLTKNVFMCVLLHAWGNVLGSMFIGDAVYSPPSFFLLFVYLIEIVIFVIIFSIADRKKKILS